MQIFYSVHTHSLHSRSNSHGKGIIKCVCWEVEFSKHRAAFKTYFKLIIWLYECCNLMTYSHFTFFLTSPAFYTRMMRILISCERDFVFLVNQNQIKKTSTVREIKVLRCFDLFNYANFILYCFWNFIIIISTLFYLSNIKEVKNGKGWENDGSYVDDECGMSEKNFKKIFLKWWWWKREWGEQRREEKWNVFKVSTKKKLFPSNRHQDFASKHAIVHTQSQ